MPTMNTGAGSVLAARGPSLKRARLKWAMGCVNDRTVFIPAERLYDAQQLVAFAPVCEGAAMLSLRRPELCQIVARHNPMFEHGARPHAVQRRFLSDSSTTRRRAVVPAQGQQHVPPMPVRQECGWNRPEPVELLKACGRRVSATQLQQRERAVQVPVA